MRVIVPLRHMHRIRHVLQISVSALNDELERYIENTWHQSVIRRNVLIDGHTEERVFLSDSNESVFIDMESFLKQFDQGHFYNASLEDLLKEIRWAFYGGTR